MGTISALFKESHTALGVFYPLHYTIAVFRDLPLAEQVKRKLVNAGFADDEVIAVEGKAFLDLEEQETGIGTFFMQEVSRFLGCEQISTDHSLDFAKLGASFVMVYCPSEKKKKEAWAVMEPEAPLSVHFYDRLGVEHISCRFNTHK